MPYVAPKATRTWEELIADIDLALSGDECDVDVVKQIMNRFVVVFCFYFCYIPPHFRFTSAPLT